MRSRERSYYHGWNIVIACVLSQLAALGVTLNCFSLFLKGWSAEFHTPVSELALGVTIFSLGCALFTLPAGLAVERFPIRWVVGLALTAITLVHLAIGFTTAGWQVVAIYALILPAAITFSTAVPAQAMVTRWFVRRRGTAMGLTAFGLALAGVIFPPIITRVLPLLGWRGTWWLFAGLIGLVIMPVVLVLLRDRPGPEESAAYVTAEPHHAATEGSALSVKQVLGRPRFWAIIGVFLSIQLISMTVSVELAPIALSRGIDLPSVGGLLSIYSAMALAGKLSSGLAADRFGNRAPFAVVTASAACGVALLSHAHGMAMFVPALALIGLSQGHWTLLASSVAAEFGPASFPRAYGVISALTPIGAIAPPIVARIYERHGDYSASLLTLAAVAVAGSAAALLALRDRGPALQAAAAKESYSGAG